MPATPSSSPLKEVLFAEYDGFANKSYKNIDKYSVFIADDRSEGDYDAKKQLFLWFCSIFADVKAPDRVTVTLSGGIPKSSAVTLWRTSLHVDVTKHPLGISERWVFDVKPANVGTLLTLATAMRSITARGAPRYAEKAYKYVVPRTANSLVRLHNVLHGYWGNHT